MAHVLIEQTLNGLQYAALLFLIAAGLTLVFGVMNVINLAHGSCYMVGAYVGAATLGAVPNFGLALLAGGAGAALYGLVLERLVISRLYRRGHLDQVLATFGLALVTNELVSIVFGRTPPFVAMPAFLSGSVDVLGVPYPVTRLSLIAAGGAVALGLWAVINRTRVGMLIRAGADDPDMLDGLGVDTRLLFATVFVAGAALAGLAGVAASPLLAVQIGMGERILIAAFVVIVVGGVGSVRGALVGAVLVGLADTMGRAFIPRLIDTVLPPAVASTVSAGLVSGSIFALMAVILVVRPRGLVS